MSGPVASSSGQSVSRHQAGAPDRLCLMDEPRTVYVAFEAFPRPKGASTHMALVLQALARHRPPVALLCLGHGAMPSFQQEGAISIWRFKEHHPNLLRRAEGFGRFVARQVASWRHVETVVFRDPWGGVPALAAAPGALAVFEVNGLPSWELPETWPRVARNAALLEKLRDLEWACLRRARAVVVPSHVTANALSGLGVQKERIHVIPNAAAEAFFRRSNAGRHSRAGRRLLAYVGSLHPWQGVEMLLEAFRKVVPAHPNVRLAVVSGARRKRIRVLARWARRAGLGERVFFPRAMSQGELARFLGSAALTAAPLLETPRNTLQGCCPVKIVESMAAGVPVLASDLAATRELVVHGRDGWLVAPGSIRAWALALDRLLGEPSLLERLGCAARQTAEARFRSRSAMRRWLEVLDGSSMAGPGHGDRVP